MNIESRFLEKLAENPEVLELMAKNPKILLEISQNERLMRLLENPVIFSFVVEILTGVKNGLDLYPDATNKILEGLGFKKDLIPKPSQAL